MLTKTQALVVSLSLIPGPDLNRVPILHLYSAFPVLQEHFNATEMKTDTVKECGPLNYLTSLFMMKRYNYHVQNGILQI